MSSPASHSAHLNWSSALHTLPDGRELWWQRISPPKPRAVVLFVHGFADHSDFALYNAARAFAQHTGCAALLVDMPGHGRSDGLHGLVPQWGTHLEALGHWCDTVCTSETGGELPLFAFGSSMGGAIAIGLALRRPEVFAGLLLVAPMVRVAPHVRPHLLVESAMHVLGRVPVLQDLPLFRGKDLTALNYAADAAWRLEEDRRLNALHYWGRLRLRTARSIIEATDGISEQMDRISTPLLVLHGAADRTTAPELSEELVQRAAASDKRIVLIPGATHGLHYGESTSVMQDVYRIMFEWLDERVTRLRTEIE